jgi:hypothetical protein
VAFIDRFYDKENCEKPLWRSKQDIAKIFGWVLVIVAVNFKEVGDEEKLLGSAVMWAGVKRYSH